MSSAPAAKTISTHAPRTGSDRGSEQSLVYAIKFQPTLPARGATRSSSIVIPSFPISTHAPRTGSDHAPCDALDAAPISTHAPRTGSDLLDGRTQSKRHYFNPRSPHGERQIATIPSFLAAHFNPRSPHGERPFVLLSQ